MHEAPVGVVTPEMERILKLVVENGGVLLRIDDHFCADGKQIATPEEIWKIIHTDWIDVDHSFFQVRIELLKAGQDYYDGLTNPPKSKH